MDSQKIEQLLDAYFEGETSIADEKILQTYFKGDQVAPHLEAYRGLFTFYATAKSEKSQLTPEIPESSNPAFFLHIKKWYSVAALIVIALGVSFFVQNNSNNLSSEEEKQAKIAFENTKEALNFFSHQFNKSAQKLAVIDEFNNSTNKVFK